MHSQEIEKSKAEQGQANARPEDKAEQLIEMGTMSGLAVI